MAFDVKFNNVSIPSYVRVTDVSYSALPEINTKTRQLPNRRGLIDTGTDFGAKFIRLQFQLVPTATDNVMELTAQFVTWLIGDNFKLCDLWTSDQSDRNYRARVNNLVEIQDEIFVGRGTVEFVVPSGTSYKAGTPVTTGSTTVNYTYSGTAVGYPIVEFTPSSTVTGILQFTLTDGQKLRADGTFTAGIKYTFDCKNRIFKVGSTVNMSYVLLDNTWVEFQTAKQYTLTCNRAGSTTINSDINNY